MSRKLALTLVALGTLASTALIAGSANAMIARGGASFHGGGDFHTGGSYHGGPRLHIPIRQPGLHVHEHGHDHFRHRYVWWRHWWRHGHVYPVGYVAGAGYVARAAEPGPCTCLTKEYTPDGIVVFKDLCTKEMASAPVDGAPVQGGQNADPNNFAGKTYQDYLAANPQAQAAPQKN